MNDEDISLIFETLSQNNPNPKIELNYTNDFTLLIAIVLSARTTDVSVNKITPKLFAVADNPSSMLQLTEDELKSYINTIGLYNSKANNIMKLCHILLEKHNEKVPLEFDELLSLPGVGRKSANVFINVVCNKKVMAVDTHVLRVSNRLGLTSEINPKKVEMSLLKIIPDKWLHNAHNWLVLHGRYVCKAKNPKCEDCAFTKICKHYKKVNGT